MRHVRGVGRLAEALSVVAAIGVSTGCGTDSPVATRTDPTRQLWRLVIDQRAVTIAVNQTLQLTATPQNAAGDALTSLPTATFQTLDATALTVDAQGLMHANAPTTTATVVASLTIDGVTAADTIPVVVTATPETFASLSMQPTDSANVAVGASIPVAALAEDDGGQQLYDLSIRYWVSDPTLATISSGSLQGLAKGKVWVYASTTSFGVTATDSAQYTITNPLFAYMLYSGSAVKNGGLDTVVVGAGGTVEFFNYSTGPVGLSFGADSTKVTGGNIPSIDLYGAESRTFPVEGQYIVSDPLGNSGLILVLPP